VAERDTGEADAQGQRQQRAARRTGFLRGSRVCSRFGLPRLQRQHQGQHDHQRADHPGVRPGADHG